MDKEKLLLDVQVQARRMGNLLNECLDLTRQLADAVSRDDQVSIGLIVGMRAEPLDRLKLTDQMIQDMCGSLNVPEERKWFTDLLNGTGAVTDQEKALVERMNANAKLLKEIVALDQVLNRRVSRGEVKG